LHGFVDLQPLRFILMKIGAARWNIQIRNSRSRPAKSANRRPGFCAQEMKRAPTGLSRYAAAFRLRSRRRIAYLLPPMPSAEAPHRACRSP
jgi:hypothetical protein